MGIAFPRKGEAPKGALSTCYNCTCNPWKHPRLMMSSNSHIHTAGAVLPMFRNNLRHPNSIPISPPFGSNKNQPPFMPYKFFSFTHGSCYCTSFAAFVLKLEKLLTFVRMRGKGAEIEYWAIWRKRISRKASVSISSTDKTGGSFSSRLTRQSPQILYRVQLGEVREMLGEVKTLA